MTFPVYDDERGRLLPLDLADLPFAPRRVFVVTGPPQGATRGGHAVPCRELVVLVTGAATVRHDGVATELTVAGRPRAARAGRGRGLRPGTRWLHDPGPGGRAVRAGAVVTRASVLIPAHNKPTTLPLTVDTVLRQSVEDLEVIVIGDGVTDAVRDVVAGLERSDERVRFLDFEKGPHHGERYRHDAVLAARSDAVFYLCDDDLLLPEHVADLLALLEDHTIVQSLNGFCRVDGTVEFFVGDLADPDSVALVLDESLQHNFVSITGTAHSKAFYERAGLHWDTTPAGRVAGPPPVPAADGPPGLPRRDQQPDDRPAAADQRGRPRHVDRCRARGRAGSVARPGGRTGRAGPGRREGARGPGAGPGQAQHRSSPTPEGRRTAAGRDRRAARYLMVMKLSR